MPRGGIVGDWKLGNLGIHRSNAAGANARAVLLDWALVGPGPPASDLAWYLALNSARLPASKERCMELYREALSHQLGSPVSDEWWVPQLELCLLGALVLFGWEKALGAARGQTEGVRTRERAELDWWCVPARAGAGWLQSA